MPLRRSRTRSPSVQNLDRHPELEPHAGRNAFGLAGIEGDAPDAIDAVFGLDLGERAIAPRRVLFQEPRVVKAHSRGTDLFGLRVVQIRVAGHAKQLQDREHRLCRGIAFVQIFEAKGLRPDRAGAPLEQRADLSLQARTGNVGFVGARVPDHDVVHAANPHLDVPRADVQPGQELDFAAQVDDAIKTQGSSSGALRGEADDGFEQGAKIVKFLGGAYFAQPALHEGDEVDVDMPTRLGVGGPGANHADEGQIPLESRLIARGIAGFVVPVGITDDLVIETADLTGFVAAIGVSRQRLGDRFRVGVEKRGARIVEVDFREKRREMRIGRAAARDRGRQARPRMRAGSGRG